VLHEAAAPQVEQLGVQLVLQHLLAKRAFRPPKKLLPQQVLVWPHVSQAGAAGTSFSTHLATFLVPWHTSV
jgi:hypothetical protein